jgi:hypothetical protein
VGFTIYRYPKTAILWIGALGYFLAAVATIAVNRAVPFGLVSAATPRYYADMLPYFIAVALMAVIAKPVLIPDRILLPALSIVLALTGAGGFHLIEAASRVLPVWPDPPRVADWISNAKASFRRVGRTATIENGVAPAFVIAPWAYPQSQYDNFLRMFRVRGIVVPPGQAQYRFDDRGNLVAIGNN